MSRFNKNTYNPKYCQVKNSSKGKFSPLDIKITIVPSDSAERQIITQIKEYQSNMENTTNEEKH